jgi:hypothetical protein
MMTAKTSVMKTIIATALAACCATLAGADLAAQVPEAPVLLIIDKDSIEYGVEPYQVPPDALNDLISAVGVRDPLPFFAANVGRRMVLRTGAEGNDSWFGLTNVPPSWESTPGANDGLENYLLAGPGLGSPDRQGDRESLLGLVPGVIAVRSSAAAALAGRTVCAVIYDADMTTPDGGAQLSLKGANMGVVAFRIGALANTVSQFASVWIDILDIRETCSGKVSPLPQPEGPQ